ncbi:uncharacterized protein LOC107465695 [Arachis duranensis]|uniref:Uncharacterized protein LOC107465695 n=1 Tax=Arachis duranensis TaxID=130453 RepID=A0A6P4C1T4_ARADU|nr:uncharacterized protein LOC107465695 [Arachis duranensis]
MRHMHQEMRSNMQNQGAANKKLETQVGYLSQQIPKPINSFPSDTENNPRGEAKIMKWEECKAIILRSRKILEEEATKREDHNKEAPTKELEEQKQEGNKSTQNDDSMKQEAMKPFVPKTPYPQRISSTNATVHQVHEGIATKEKSLEWRTNYCDDQGVQCSHPKRVANKEEGHGSFHIPCTIGNKTIDRGFCDLGASINLMPLSLMKKLQITELQPTQIALELADKSYFVILDMEEDYHHPIILGRPFLATARALINVERGELVLRVHDEQLVFHVFKTMHDFPQENDCMKIDSVDTNLKEAPNESPPELLSPCLKEKKEVEEVQQVQEVMKTKED